MKALINSIKITGRVRKELTKIDELAADIQANGLLHPVTVMAADDGEFRLLAGLRRLRAVEKLGYSEIDINVVAPADAEAALRIEISENEQREPFTFSEKMDFARMLEEIEAAKAKKRMLAGKKVGIADPAAHGRQGQKGETNEIVAEKLGMGETSYRRAKYIAENAPDEVIEELDQGKRSIRGTYEELRAKGKEDKLSGDISEDAPADAESDGGPEDISINTPQADVSKKRPDTAGLLSKADEEAVRRNMEFNALPPEEKIKELQRQLKEERARASQAESELGRLKELRHNDIFHKDGIIQNLRERLAEAEARIKELEESLS